MIRHIVLIKFKPDFDEEGIARVFDELLAIKGKIPGLLDITAGKSESPEKIERGYMHGFIADFENWEALAAYQAHPDHQAVGAQLIENAVGGIGGILVLDIPVETGSSAKSPEL